MLKTCGNNNLLKDRARFSEPTITSFTRYSRSSWLRLHPFNESNHVIAARARAFSSGKPIEMRTH